MRSTAPDRPLLTNGAVFIVAVVLAVAVFLWAPAAPHGPEPTIPDTVACSPSDTLCRALEAFENAEGESLSPEQRQALELLGEAIEQEQPGVIPSTPPPATTPPPSTTSTTAPPTTAPPVPTTSLPPPRDPGHVGDLIDNLLGIEASVPNVTTPEGAGGDG